MQKSFIRGDEFSDNVIGTVEESKSAPWKFWLW